MEKLGKMDVRSLKLPVWQCPGCVALGEVVRAILTIERYGRLCRMSIEGCQQTGKWSVAGAGGFSSDSYCDDHVGDRRAVEDPRAPYLRVLERFMGIIKAEA